MARDPLPAGFGEQTAAARMTVAKTMGTRPRRKTKRKKKVAAKRKTKRKTTKRATRAPKGRLKKGSAAAKRRMAQLRAMQGKKRRR